MPAALQHLFPFVSIILKRSIESLTLIITMPSVFTHAVVPIALYSVFPKSIAPPVLLAATIFAAVPDLDVVGFNFGIKYDAMLGHRGLTHSFAFAVLRLNPVTVNRPLTVIKHMFKKTVEWDLVKSNPATSVKRFTVTSERTRFLTQNEIQSLLQECEKRVPRRGFTFGDAGVEHRHEAGRAPKAEIGRTSTWSEDQ